MTKINKEGWEIVPLCKVSNVLNGYAFKSDKYADEGVRVLRITNVQKGSIVDNDPKFYSFEDFEELKNYELFEGDLLMSLTGNVGRVGILEAAMVPAALNQRVACLRITSDKLSKKYLFHLLNSDLFEQEAIASARGIAQKNMSTEWLKAYNIPLPPLPIQQRIVEELDEINAIISAKKQQISKLDELAQSIFYNMFGDPVSNEMGWEVKSFKQCFSLKSGDGLSAKNFLDGQYPVYGGNGIAGYHNTFNKEGKNIIIGRVGALCGNVHLVEGRIFVTDNAFVLSTDENFKATALLYLLRFLNWFYRNLSETM